MEALGAVKRTREEELERRYQQEGMSVQWLIIALAVARLFPASDEFLITRTALARHDEGEVSGFCFAQNHRDVLLAYRCAVVAFYEANRNYDRGLNCHE